LKTVSSQIPRWVIRFLKFAGYYNLAWGVYILSKPLDFYQAFNPEVVNTPFISYPFGVAVILFGVFYLLAATSPIRFQVLIFLGLGSKLFGPLVGYLLLLEPNYQVLNFYLHITFNDILWVIPMAWAFYLVFKAGQNTETEGEKKEAFPAILQEYHTQSGENLADLNQEKPLLIVFLRHFGCTFCKEALADIAIQRVSLEQNGVKLVFIHMAKEKEAGKYFSQYGLEDVARVSDSSCALYQSFNLKRANFGEVFGLKSFTRGFYAGIFKGHGVGKLVGDGFRMPGVFLVHQHKILKSYKHQSAADVPDYQELSICEIS
jgi:peroxiredoxin